MNKKSKYGFKKIIKNNLSMLNYISKYCPRFIYVSIILAIISSFMQLISTYYTKIVIDTMGVNGTVQKLLFIIIIFLIINVSFSSLARWLNSYVSNKYSFYLNYGMSLEILKKLEIMDYEHYHNTDFHNNVMKAIEQSDTRAQSVLSSINILISSILSIGTFSIIISTFNPFLFIVIGISVISSLFFTSIISRVEYDNYNKNIKHFREKAYVQRLYFLENYAKEIRMNNSLSEILNKKFENAVESLLSNTLNYSIKIFKISLFQVIISTIMSSIITFFLGIKVIHKSIIISDYFFISSSVGQLVNQLTLLFNIIPKLYEDSLYIDDFLKFLNIKPKIKEEYEGYNINEIKTINFENVSFIYPNTMNTILSSISFDISKGEKILVIGRNGSGKSTLLKLLCRLYDITEGELTINNILIQNIKLSNIRKRIGIVFQDFEIYATSIAENILMRTVEDNEKDFMIVKNALESVGLWEKISSFKDGIYSNMTRELDNNGILLSGGEEQLLAIARVFAQNYDIVIFDEPFSSLDPIAEAKLANKILEIFYNKTVILVSHRLTNVKNIGKIIYFENGKIEEIGTHEKLYRQSSKYKEFYNAQNGV
jgi:ATP-binding cassette subfamily B protein